MIILYIDDDTEDIEVFRDALISVDPRTVLYTAKDGIEGFRVLGNQALIPDFIFLDINMPRMNGREFLHRIKQTVGLRSIPVIMYSTTSQQSEIDALIKAGAAGFIVKPNNFEKLHLMLKNLLFPELSTNRTIITKNNLTIDKV